MNKVEKVKAEIKKRYKDNQADGYTDVCEELFDLCTFIDSLEEEPVSNDLEKAAIEAFKKIVDSDKNSFLEIFKAGAQWQKKHLFDNRIKDCNNITEEQYNLETEFLDGWIEKYDRLPTFLDAIEYGMKLQKEQDQSTIELAEDHAMLAGMEKMRQEMIDKFFKWLAKHWREYVWLTDNDVIHFGHWEYDFKKAMEE